MPAAKPDQVEGGAVDPSTFRVAIVGGGIGGLSVALSIATYCPSLPSSNLIVYEQAPAYTEIGAGISIGVSAGRVLQKLGVYEAVNAISGYRTNVHRSNHRWDTDELIVNAPAANSGGPDEDVRQLWLHRAEFLEVLFNEVKRRNCATLKVNKRVVNLEVRSPKALTLFVTSDELLGPWIRGDNPIFRWHRRIGKFGDRM